MGTAPAVADCTKEVTEAVKLQSATKIFRKETNMITQNGPAKMTIEVVAPDRMRQVVTLLTNPKPVESILIGGKAWSNGGGAWKKLDAEATGQLFTFFQSITGPRQNDVGTFRCLGVEPVKGRQLRAYMGIEDTSKPTAGKDTRPKNEAERIIYVDPKTGLLAGTIYARKGMRDKPIYAETYTYPTSVDIAEPKIN
ncbi:MAG: hypothetical protein K0U34_03190 [Alphaproteobacteria bacterium]|nr:hypothetical protein [Alphaproteobacteria bacterium]